MKVFSKWKLAICLFTVVLYASLLFSQQNHFIYIQSDDKQPFSVSVNGKTYSSSDAGYLIIPKLSLNEHVLKITFPGNKYPEQSFSCTLNNSDVGYALKNYGEKGWGLFNFQTLDLVMSGDTAKSQPQKEETAKNAFGEMLSNVVDDTTLTIDAVTEKEQPKITNEPQKTETIPEANLDNAADTKSVVVSGAAVVVPVAVDQSAKKKIAQSGNVKKLSEKLSEDSTELVFTAKNGKKTDTIRIIIPVTKVPATDTVENGTDEESAKIDTAKTPDIPIQEPVDSAKVVPTTEGGVKNPFYVPAAAEAVNKSTESLIKSDVADSTDKAQSNKTVPVVSMSASVQECKKMLSEGDFDKVKRKMFIEANDNKMIEVARKSFQGKCVTTNQIKNLSVLFPSDEGRFNFFNSAYSFVSDPAAYSTLKGNLIDPGYKKRFDLMFSK